MAGRSRPEVSLRQDSGEYRAPGTVARKCTAAAVRYLKEMHGTQQYKDLGLPWNEFCVQLLRLDRDLLPLCSSVLPSMCGNSSRYPDGWSGMSCAMLK